MSTVPRILIVEDDAILVMDLQDTLTKLGYQTAGMAATGKAAVEIALAEQPDVILMDIHLRGNMNGIQAAEQIHTQQDIPIIYLTAYTDDILLQQAKATDAYAYLAKPVRERELRASLEMALYKHAAEKRHQHITQVLRAVRDVSQLITREQNALRLVDEAVKILLRTRGYRFVWIGQPLDDFHEVHAFAGEGIDLLNKIFATTAPDERDRLPSVAAARSRQIVVCQDILHDERYTRWWKELEEIHVHSMVAIPIAYPGDLLGVLAVYADLANHFNEEEIDLLLELASDVAFGLKAIAEEAGRRHAEEAIRQRNAELTALYQIGQTLSKLAEPSEILEHIFSEIGKVLDNRNLFITLYEKERQYISFEVYTIDGERHDGIGRPLANGITDYIIRNNRPFLVKQNLFEALRQHGIDSLGKPARSFIGVPVHTDDEVIGVIALQDYDHEQVYNEHHLELLTTIAAQASSALENARLYHTAQQELEERKRAEMALVESQALINAIVESTLDMIWSVDPENFGLLTFNHGLSVYFLQGRGMTIHTGMRPEDLFPPGEFVKIWREFYQRALREGPYSVEYRTFSGLVTLQLTFNLLQRDGRVFGISVFGKDITERKQAEVRIRQSEKKYRELFQVNKDGIAIFLVNPNGPPGTFIEVNDAAPRMLGYSQEEMLERTPMMLEPNTPHEQLQARQSELEAKGTLNFETILLHKNGHPVYTEFSAQVIHYEGKPAVMNIVRDVTERKRAEETLLESEARFREVLENSLDASYKRNLQTNTYDYLSPVFTQISGYTPDEFINLPLETVLNIIHPDDRAKGESVIAESMSGAHGASSRWDYRFKHKDGRYRWLLDQFTTMRDAQGQPAALIGSVSDITERKQRENELQVIASLSTALRTAPQRADMLPVIVEQMVALLNCDAVSIEMIDPLTGDAVLELAHGAWQALTGTRQKNGTGINAIISQTLKPYFTNDLHHEPDLTYPEEYDKDIQGCIGAPMIAQEQLIGFLWIGRRTEIGEGEVRLLSAVADITANAIHRATLHERSLQSALDLTLAYDTTLEGWVHALELRDHETEGHARNVVKLTVDLARAFGISEEEMQHVRRGALLHDIGKMGVPDAILLKPGPLNQCEWDIMRRHPVYAYQLLEPIEYLRPVLDIPYDHHEKWDGSGYPRGLKGEEIPLVARIFAIIDVWDALITDRPYRKAWSFEKAYQHLREQSGKHFDPQVVQKFFEMLGTP